MTFDAHANFVISAIAVAPSPPASGNSVTVTTGDGSKFPEAPFNCTIWPANTLATSANAEIVRVTNVAGDVLTILRAQEGSSVRTIIAGDHIAVTITSKTLTDVERAIPVSGSVSLGNDVDAGAVTGLALSFTPTAVKLQVSRPSGGLIIVACDNDDLGSDGFTFELSAKTDSPNYRLHYALFP